MTELPDYLKEIEKSIVKSAQQNRWLGWGEQTFLFENLPRIIEDFKQLQKDKAEMIKALESFKKYAEWSSGDSNDWPKTSRACGAGCDMGGAGEPMTDTGHDSDCPIERAREVLERMKQKKTIK